MDELMNRHITIICLLAVSFMIGMTVAESKADPSDAASTKAEPFKTLDDRPKVIFYLSNSHKGADELQEHLTHAGYPHLKVHNIPLAYKFKMDPKTGEFTGASFLERMLKTAKEQYPGHDMVMVRQGNSGAPFDYQVDDAEEKAQALKRGADNGWRVKSNGEYLAMFRKKLMEHGFKDFYFYNHHYSRPGGNDNKGHPLHLETIDELNKLVGYEVGIDCWPKTKPYYPRTVGYDYWHNNHFGKLAKTQAVIEAMARNSGVTDIPLLDLDEELKKFEAEQLKFFDITPVGTGQTYAVGDTIDITWKVIDADLYPRANIYLEVNGGRNKMLIAANVVSAREHFRWTIPDTKVGLGHKNERPVPIVNDQCRIRVGAVWEGKPANHRPSTSGIAPGFFKIAPAGTTPTDAPELGPEPTKLEDNLRTSGKVSYRIARWPGFSRSAIAIAIEDDGSAELLTMLTEVSKREHPDLMTVVASGNNSKRHDAIRKLGHEVLTALPVKTGATQATYRVLPESQSQTQVYHLETGSEAAMRALIKRVLAERSAAIVTYGKRGADFEAQIDALHDYHAELWNGPVNALLSYSAQARTAKVTVEQFDRREGIELRLTDGLADGTHRQPLWLQIGMPHYQFRGRTYQQGDLSGPCLPVQGIRTGTYLRFPMLPGAAPLVIGEK
jgi:hypothetical protein